MVMGLLNVRRGWPLLLLLLLLDEAERTEEEEVDVASVVAMTTGLREERGIPGGRSGSGSGCGTRLAAGVGTANGLGADVPRTRDSRGVAMGNRTAVESEVDTGGSVVTKAGPAPL